MTIYAFLVVIEEGLVRCVYCLKKEKKSLEQQVWSTITVTTAETHHLTHYANTDC